MSGIRTIATSMALVALFFFCMLAFAVQTQTNNPTNSSLSTDPNFNATYQSISGAVASTSTVANATSSTFNSENPVISFGQIVMLSIVGVYKLITSTVISAFNIIAGISMTYLGIPPVVIGVIGGILVITLTLLAWRLWRWGQ
jgi:hypothetical protein